MGRDLSPYSPQSSVGLGGAVKSWRTAAPDDGNDLARVGIGVRNNSQANATVKLTDVTGHTETFHLGAGHALTVSVLRVWATGTSAGGVVQVAYEL